MKKQRMPMQRPRSTNATRVDAWSIWAVWTQWYALAAGAAATVIELTRDMVVEIAVQQCTSLIALLHEHD